MSTALWWTGMTLLNASLILFVVGGLRRNLKDDLMPWGLAMLAAGQILVMLS